MVISRSIAVDVQRGRWAPAQFTRCGGRTLSELNACHAVLSRRSFMRRRKPCAKAGSAFDSLPVRSLARRRVRRFLPVQTKAPSRHFCSHRPVGGLEDAWLTAHRAVATAENRSAQPDSIAGIGDAGGRSTQRSRDHRSRLQYKQKRPAEAGRFELIKLS